MKVTIYELLGMIKDGKIPEKIIFNGYEYSYHDKEYGYCRNAYDCTYICINSEYYLFDILNDEVEILEEPRDIEVCGTWITKTEYNKLAHSEEEKKIPEKIEYYDDSIAWVIDDVGQLSDVDKVIIDKLNDVIDYLKSKGE